MLKKVPGSLCPLPWKGAGGQPCSLPGVLGSAVAVLGLMDPTEGLGVDGFKNGSLVGQNGSRESGVQILRSSKGSLPTFSLPDLTKRVPVKLK